jgi:tetratricopeptide (TPR) repeat protein
MAACYLDMAVVYQQQLNFILSEEYYKNALRLYEEIGYQMGITISLLDLGSLYFNYNLNKAEEYCMKALEIAKLIGAKRDLVFIYDNLGLIHLRRLMIDRAMEDFDLALRYAKETNFIEGLSFINVHLSELYRETKRLNHGLRHLKKAYSYAQRVKLSQYINDCMFEEIEYLLIKKDLKRARILVQKLFKEFKDSADRNRQILSYIYRGRILAASGDFKKAMADYERALKAVIKLPDNLLAGEIYYFQGLSFKNQDRFEEAIQMFLKANEIFMKMGNLLYIDKIEREIASANISKRN